MTAANMGYITSVADLARLAARVVSDGLPIALDCETGYEGEDRSYKNTSPSLHPEESLLAGFSFTNSASWARYVPVGHDESRYNIAPAATARVLWDITATGLCVVHNADMEERVLSRFLLRHLADDPERGEAVRASRGYFPLRTDTMMECHALAGWQSIALKSLSREVFGYDQVELRDLFSRVTGKPLPANRRYSLRFNVLDPSDPRVFGYACDDVVQTLRLHQRHYDLAKDNFIYRLEMGVWPVVWGMEDEGLAVDWDFVDEARVRASMFRDRMQARLTGYLGERLGKPVKFNPNSPVQLRKILYDPDPDGLGLKTRIMTRGKKDGSGKQMSTAAIALKGNAVDPFVRRLQDYRGMTKLLGTYLEPWKREYGWCEDGRAHCHLLPHGAVTGRTSSSDFNYQNLPKKYHYELDDGSVFELNFRDCVTVPPGYWGLGFDISQGELRIIAAEAGEQAMLEAFERDEDLHALTAARILQVSVEEVHAGGELFGRQVDSFRPFGKAQPRSEPVLTPQGWRCMGEIQSGDEVIGGDGQPVKVTGVFPQGRKEVFRVKFADGAWARSCGEHYWTVGSHDFRGKTRTLQLSEIAGRLVRSPGERRYWVNPVQPVEMHPNFVPIAPYAFGLLLGDGSFRGTGPSFSSVDLELLDALQFGLSFLSMDLKLKHADRCSYWIVGHGRKGRGSVGPLVKALRDLGLWGKSSHEKFIPACYLGGPSIARLYVLQGLFDTDGYPVKNGGVEYCTASDQLAADVQYLVRSLGGTARKARNSAGGAWRVYVRLPDGMEPFRLARKRERYSPTKRLIRNRIVAVESDGYEDTQCISVDAADGLYVTRDFVLTHNTMNFALAYQLTVQGLADRLGCSIEDAQEAFDGYFAAYPAIAAWTRRTVAESKVQGYTQSRFGRRHPIWDYGKNHCWQHRVAEHGCWQCEKTAKRNLESGERTAGNAPIQGGLADMMKLIMIRCDAALAKAGLKDRVRLVMNVHDALEFYVHGSVSLQEVIDLLYPSITAKTPMTQHWPVMRPDWHTWTRWGSPVEVKLDGDHQVTGLGDTLDIGLQEEDEEDDDAEGEAEAIPVAAWPPDVATGSPAAVVRPPDRMGGGSDPGVGDSKAGHTGRVLVKVREMPELARVDRLMLMLGEFPGPNQLDLVVPEGQVTLSRGTSLSPADGARISLLLGSAEVVWDTQSVDNAALAQGLALLPEKVGPWRYGRA